MGFTKDNFGFKDDYFYYHLKWVGGRFTSPELCSLKGVYHIKDISYMSLHTGEYGTLMDVNVYGEMSRNDVSVKSFYLDDYKENKAYYDTLVHNVNTRIKHYEKEIEDRDTCFVGKMFVVLLILFIAFMVYTCGIS